MEYKVSSLRNIAEMLNLEILLRALISSIEMRLGCNMQPVDKLSVVWLKREKIIKKVMNAGFTITNDVFSRTVCLFEVKRSVLVKKHRD